MDCFKVNEYHEDEDTKVTWQIYGYTGHYSVYISTHIECLCQLKYKLPENIDFESIKEVRAVIKNTTVDGYYVAAIRGFALISDNNQIEIGTKTGIKVPEKPLPYENVEFYRHIDVLLRLAKKLDIQTDIGDRNVEYNPTKVYQLASLIEEAVDNKLKPFKDCI